MSTINPDAIDVTKPTEGTATTASVRANEAATKAQLTAAKADIEAVEAHVADVANPHSVTAAQAGADPTGTAAAAVAAHAGTNTHAQIDAHIASTANPHAVTAAQAGADPAGTAAAAVAAHEGAADPHPTYLTAAEGAAAYAPLAHVGGTGAAHGNFAQDVAGFVPGPTAGEISANFVLEATGAWVAQTGGTAGHNIEDEGTPLPPRAALNFVGAGVVATDDAGNDATVVTISGGGSSGYDTVQENATPVTQRTIMNFGTGILAADNAGSSRTDVSIVDSEIVHDNLSGFVADEHVAHSGVSITAGAGLTGGGTIAASRQLDVDINGLTADATPDGAADYVMTYDANAAGLKKVLLDNLPGDGTGYDTVQDEGTPLTARGTLNFVGAGVVVTDDAGSGRTNVTISGGAGAGYETVQEDGTPVTQRTVLNFGAGLTAADNAGSSRTDVDVDPAEIDHDALLNFAAAEHVDHSAVSITAGAGLTGGGTIEATRDLAVGAGDGITVNANDVAVDSTVARINAANDFTANQSITVAADVRAGLSIASGTGVNDVVVYMAPTSGSVDSRNFYIEGGGGTLKVHGSNDAGVQQGNPELEISHQGGVVLNAATGGDQGAGTLNASGLYVGGVAALTGITGESIGDLSDVTVGAPTSGQILQYSAGWSNVSLNTAGISEVGHTHAATDVISGTFDNARISAGNVTQHVGSIDHNSLLNYSAGEHRTINDAGSATTDLWSASKITTELAAKASSTHTHTFSVPHTWALSGTVANGTPPGMFAMLGTGDTAVAARLRTKLGAGTCTIQLQKNGTNITGATASVTTTAATVDFADSSLADGDEITCVITAATGATDLSVTLEVRRTAAS